VTRLKNWDDQKSWREFFDTYWKLIYSVSVKAGLSDAEAQDVVQEVVIGVTKKIKDLKYDPALGSFKGWLMTMTRWRIADQMRSRGPVVHHAGRNDDNRRTATIERIPDPAGFDLDAAWEEEWLTNLTEAALARVKSRTSAKQFQMFECYVVKGWKVSEVTKTLGVSAGQVYLAKHRVSKELRKEIEKLEDEAW